MNGFKAYRYAGELRRIKGVLGTFAVVGQRHHGQGVVCVCEADLAKARRTRRFDEMVAQYVTLKDVRDGGHGDASPAEFFYWLLEEANPATAFVLMVTGQGRKIAEVFLVEKP